MTSDPSRNGYVGLTFDDGPHPQTTMALLGELKARDARATFFVSGQNVRRYPGLLRATRDAGMWIGNHAFSHPYLTQISEPAAYQEIASTQQEIRQVTGETPTLFRPPYGATSDQVRAGQARLGLTEVLWTVDTLDWAGASAQDIADAAAAAEPGGIILMHDGGIHSTVEALPQILSGLASRGLRPGRIAYTPADVSGNGTIFHATAVAP